MTKTANSLAGYIALLRQLAFFCKGWVGDDCRDHSICIMACMESCGWGAPTPYIYQLFMYIYTGLYIFIYSSYNLHAVRFGPPPPNKISGYANG